MKTSGAVYKKLREVKFHHLIALYRIYLKKIPQNCKYNYLYVLQGRDGIEYEVGLCLFHQQDVQLKLDPPRLSGVMPHLMDICEAAEDCRLCNAFVSRYDRQGVKDLFEKELATKNIKVEKYPDICALEWVLERPAVGVAPLGNIFQILINGIKKILKHKQE